MVLCSPEFVIFKLAQILQTAGAPLCGFYMFPLCLTKISTGTHYSNHSTKTHMLAWLGANVLFLCGSLITAAIGSSKPELYKQLYKWMNGRMHGVTYVMIIHGHNPRIHELQHLFNFI